MSQLAMITKGRDKHIEVVNASVKNKEMEKCYEANHF